PSGPRAGEDLISRPVRNVHLIELSGLTAIRLPSQVPKYTVPSGTKAGEESLRPLSRTDHLFVRTGISPWAEAVKISATNRPLSILRQTIIKDCFWILLVMPPLSRGHVAGTDPHPLEAPFRY